MKEEENPISHMINDNSTLDNLKHKTLLLKLRKRRICLVRHPQRQEVLAKITVFQKKPGAQQLTLGDLIQADSNSPRISWM